MVYRLKFVITVRYDIFCRQNIKSTGFRFQYRSFVPLNSQWLLAMLMHSWLDVSVDVSVFPSGQEYDCVVLVGGSSLLAGLWKIERCAEKRGFICKRNIGESFNQSTLSTLCWVSYHFIALRMILPTPILFLF